MVRADQRSAYGGHVSDNHSEAYRLVDFLNSLHLPDGEDRLADDRAAGWLADWLGDDVPAPEPGGLTALRELREGLRQLALVNGGAASLRWQVSASEPWLAVAPSSGVLAPGESLPPERELAARLGVSRDTVREAIKSLSDAGFQVLPREAMDADVDTMFQVYRVTLKGLSK